MRKLVVVLAALAAIAGLYPVSSSICPKWDVTVVDEAGRPLEGMTVRRSCNDYSAGIHRDAWPGAPDYVESRIVATPRP